MRRRRYRTIDVIWRELRRGLAGCAAHDPDLPLRLVPFHERSPLSSAVQYAPLGREGTHRKPEGARQPRPPAGPRTPELNGSVSRVDAPASIAGGWRLCSLNLPDRPKLCYARELTRSILL